jgi:hypothetical protein
MGSSDNQPTPMSNANAEEFRISRAGKVIGTFKPARVHELLVTGVLLRTDHYWRPGMTGWVQLDEPNLDLSAMRVVAAPTPSTRTVVNHFDEADADQDESRCWIIFLSIKIAAAGLALLGLADTSVDLMHVIRPNSPRYLDILGGIHVQPVSPWSLGPIQTVYVKFTVWFGSWLLCVIIANSVHTYLVRKGVITRQLKSLKVSNEK